MTKPTGLGGVAIAIIMAIVVSTALAGGALWAGAWTGTGSADAATEARVGANGTELTLDGRPWFPVGLDAYQLGTDWSVNAGCGAMVDLNSFFSRIPERSLIRFDMYSAFALNKNTGKLDFGPLDRVIGAAAANHRLLVPVLAGSSGDCEYSGFKQRDWYVSGWRTTVGAAGLTYQQWLTKAISRWSSSPAIAGWELIGEPEASVCGAADCGWQTRTCPADASQVLRSFFDTAGTLVRRLDPKRLIFSGLAGGDQCGLVGSGYQTVTASPNVDVLDYHDYPPAEPPPGSDLTARIHTAKTLRKPLTVNEIGLLGGSCLDIGARATQLAAIVRQQRAAGTAGALLWSFVPDPRLTECTYDIGPSDPVWSFVDRPDA